MKSHSECNTRPNEAVVSERIKNRRSSDAFDESPASRPGRVKKLISILFLLFVFERSVLAECQVKYDSDKQTNSNMLRYIFVEYINGKSDPYCDGDSSDSYELIKFMSNYEIEIGSSYSITVEKADVHVDKSSSVDSYPIINGFGLAENQKPFDITCSNGGKLQLNNIIILTNGVEKDEQIDGSCIIEGSNVFVCHDEGVYDPTQTPSSANWCPDDTDTDDDNGRDRDENCDDGQDNDGDGAIDCKDSDCQGIKFENDHFTKECQELKEFDGNWPNDFDDPTDDPNDDPDDPNDDPTDDPTDDPNDDDTPTWYPDDDNDGYGDGNDPVASDTQPSGTVSNNDDCDDEASSINPSATEICDGIDNNCDGSIDEGISCDLTSPESECGDNADNDGDGLIDCDDTDCDDAVCVSTVDPDESTDYGMDMSGDSISGCSINTSHKGSISYFCIMPLLVYLCKKRQTLC